MIWAAIQNNLGNALRALGERSDDTALRRAVEAYQAALEVLRDLNAPAHIATTERNLARTLLPAR